MRENIMRHWCMCTELQAVARDCFSTCSICGGQDAYGRSSDRPISKSKPLKGSGYQPVTKLDTSNPPQGDKPEPDLTKGALRDTPYFKYLTEILNKTDVDSEQWDAINGAMHQMEDQEAEVERLRGTLKNISNEATNTEEDESSEILNDCIYAMMNMADEALTAQEVEG